MENATVPPIIRLSCLFCCSSVNTFFSRCFFVFSFWSVSSSSKKEAENVNVATPRYNDSIKLNTPRKIGMFLIFLFFIISSSPCLKALLKNFSSSILLISQENDSVKQSEMKNAGRFQLKKYDEKEKRNEKQIV